MQETVVLTPSGRPMRAMFVITDMHVGGAETLLANLLRRLDRNRFAPELCCLKTAGELGEQLAHELPVHVGLLRHKLDVRVLWRLARLFRERRVDVVVTVGAGDKMFWGRLAARLAGVPVVVCALHSTGYPDVVTWLNRRLTPLTDAFVAVADRHAQYLVDQVGLPAGRMHVIPNGVDTDRFRPDVPEAALRCELDIPAGAPVVGIVALLRPEKNHEMFLRMAARVKRELSETHFLIVGDGPGREALQSRAAEMEIADRVRFLGRRPDVPELLKLLDVFTLTSRTEANPVSILESLATGKPVVSTRVGSIANVIGEGESGYLVEPGDDLTMARRVTALLNDPALAHRLGARGRQVVMNNWSVERMVQGYEELLERLWAHKRGIVKLAPADSAKPAVPANL